MSGLAPILAGRQPTGLYRLEAAFDLEDVTATALGAGWALSHLDGAYAQTKVEVLTSLGAALAFPEHYGANFDAVADCLSDLKANTVLLWDDWGVFARSDERSFAVLRRILSARSADPTIGTPKLLVLLRGDGPDDLDVPLLD